MTSYGYFDDVSREYVITNPKTPVKWINYIGSLDFGGFVDQTGGMLICRQDPALNRITRYLTQGPPSEFKGTTLYLRVPKDEEDYTVFSPFFVPTLHPLDSYACHVGLGYSTIVSEYQGIQTEVRIFIPLGAKVVVQQVTVTNRSNRVQPIDVVPVVEYTHPDALKQLINADWVPQTVQSYVHTDEEGLTILSQAPFMLKDIQRNFLTASLPVSSFETDRKAFLGDHGYGSWASPQSLQAPKLGGTMALRGDNIGALMVHLGEIPSGESRQVIILLGQTEDLKFETPEISRYRDADEVETAFAELGAFWEQVLSTTQVSTPDPAMDRMLNVHNPRQCVVTMNWSRYLSLYQLGFGARGMGFRDSSQDVMGALTALPEACKKLIRKLMQVQKRDGSAMHQFNPLTMVANVGDSAGEEDRPKFYSDDHLWGVLAVTAYLKETGDFKFLEEDIPFYEKDRQDRPIDTATLWEHLKRAIQFTHDHTGAHGLPLLGFADWNDTVNLPAGAESLFTAHLFGCALLEMIALAKKLVEESTAEKYAHFYQSMKDSVNLVAWDGEWFVRYFDHQGQPVGSHVNTHGSIFTNAQSWAVLSGFASDQKGIQSMDAVYQYLNTEHGIKLSTPGYDGFDPEKGGVTTYPPGAKENGGIFLHANPWAMIAETMLGRGDRAYAYYRQINPANKNEQVDLFECEPYVYPQNILGDEHPQFGLARNAWLTGTAAWAYQAGIKYILGVRPEFDGLCVDPCIPAEWKAFSVFRRFRGAAYHIHVENPSGVQKGVQTINVDGVPFEGALLPIFADEKTHQVRVVMG